MGARSGPIVMRPDGKLSRRDNKNTVTTCSDTAINMNSELKDAIGSVCQFSPFRINSDMGLGTWNRPQIPGSRIRFRMRLSIDQRVQFFVVSINIKPFVRTSLNVVRKVICFEEYIFSASPLSSEAH